MHRQLKALMFDLDGTLVRTDPDFIYLAVGSALAEMGVSADEEVMRRFWFEADRRRVIEENCGVDYDAFIEVFSRYNDPQTRKGFIEAYEDTEILPAFKEKGCKLGLMTSTPVDIAELELKLFPQGLFDVVVVANSETGIPAKPSPAGLVECRKRWVELIEEGLPEYHKDTKWKDCIPYIGNADEDVIAAREAGMTDIIVARDEHPLELSPMITLRDLYCMLPLCNIWH